MIPAQQITIFCWLVFLIYWCISARSVKPTRERICGIGGYWHYALVFLSFLLINVRVFPLSISLLPRSLAIGVLSSVCALLGLGIAIAARRTLAGNWSGSVTFKEDHTLITTGIYGYMRHPIYTGVLMMFIGTALLVGTLGALMGFLTLCLSLWFKLKQEEALMRRHFPRDYPGYAERVKALVPYVF